MAQGQQEPRARLVSAVGADVPSLCLPRPGGAAGPRAPHPAAPPPHTRTPMC